MKEKSDYIIARVLSGEASSDELFAFSQWLGEEEKNRKEFELLKSYWDAEVSFDKTISVTIFTEKICEKIRKMETQRKRKQFLLMSVPAAAAIAILIIMSALFYTAKPVAEPATIQLFTYLTQKERSAFTLSDGTQVVLNKNSRLTYSSDYGNGQRTVQLEGEAYFDVVSNAQNPFIVKVDDASVNVLGTIFTVQANRESDDIMATLITGSIRFESDSRQIVLVPNQQLTFNRSTGNIDVHSVNAEDQAAWKDGLMKYHSIGFAQLITELEKVYKTKIIINNKNLTDPSVTVSGTFSQDQPMEEVLQIIARSLPIKWTVTNNTFYIN